MYLHILNLTYLHSHLFMHTWTHFCFLMLSIIVSKIHQTSSHGFHKFIYINNRIPILHSKIIKMGFLYYKKSNPTKVNINKHICNNIIVCKYSSFVIFRANYYFNKEAKMKPFHSKISAIKIETVTPYPTN